MDQHPNAAPGGQRRVWRMLGLVVRAGLIALMIAMFCPAPRMAAQEAAGPGDVEGQGIPPLVHIQLYLQAGWNLISFRIQPADPTNTVLYTAVADVLQDIDGLYESVLGYDQGALSYYPDLPPSFSDLQTLDPYHGYWIKMSEPATLDLWGRAVAANYPLTLHEGWNLISYLPTAPIAVAEALGNIEGQYTSVLGFHDGGAVSYYAELPPSFSDLKCLRPQHGYWIKMTAAATLTYHIIGSCPD